MSDHVFRYRDVVVDLAVVHGELEADEAGQDGGGSRLGLDGLGPLAGLGADDRETGSKISYSLGQDLIESREATCL